MPLGNGDSRVEELRRGDESASLTPSVGWAVDRRIRHCTRPRARTPARGDDQRPRLRTARAHGPRGDESEDQGHIAARRTEYAASDRGARQAPGEVDVIAPRRRHARQTDPGTTDAIRRSPRYVARRRQAGARAPQTRRTAQERLHQAVPRSETDALRV